MQIAFMKSHGITSGLVVPDANYKALEQAIMDQSFNVKLQNYS
jgi:hypothetical protein